MNGSPATDGSGIAIPFPPRWLPGQIPARKSYNTLFNAFIDDVCLLGTERRVCYTCVGRTKKQTFLHFAFEYIRFASSCHKHMHLYI